MTGPDDCTHPLWSEAFLTSWGTTAAMCMSCGAVHEATAQ